MEKKRRWRNDIGIKKEALILGRSIRGNKLKK